ncbi:MAG TPA: bifunctional 4-hydroxy-2-oxoglutarate aldolase/2-dehydro-3-deoxy-phosphogluconate aldolase [Candidatus Angelobacter sp.]|nr:bifunctional 4-hydroxy-2-oxoglutarate aldolase/2-dehydro-3-deoxy-phosphogluconate aldolase [Candidatus Angelobacter sp.]
MTKSEVCECIRKTGIIPAVRVQSADDAHFAADCVIDAGIPIVEITMTVLGAVQLISHLASRHPRLAVGAGTVMDTETARQCVDAGAKFLTAPSFDASLVEFAARQEIAVIPGALTPTEVVSAWRAGGDFVKVFPCAPVGGEKYIKALKTALPQIPLIAAGGVNQQTATGFILAGAEVIGVGKELIPRQSIEMREAERIRELARRFLKFVQDARQRLAPARESAGHSMH